MTTRMLVVWVPDWPVVAACPERDLPVAVMAAGRVLACSHAARVEGVGRGMRRRQAESRCPDLTVVDHDPVRDARLFEPVVVALEEMCPRVEVLRPGACAVATKGPSRYFGGDDALAARVVAVIEGVLGPGGCRVGIADGVFAAERAARISLVVPPGESATFLASYPVSTLELPELADLLRRLGIRTLGELARLPGPAVLARFGPEGTAVHRLARGLDLRPPAARVPPDDLTVTAELDPPVEQIEAAAFVARALAARLHQNLAEKGLAATGVRVEAETEHGEELSRAWRHEGITAEALAERVRWQLDGWASSGNVTAGLTLLRLVPDGLGPDSGSQPGFWGGDRRSADRVNRALARVQGALGADAVTTAVITGGRAPADQVQLVPWGEPPTRTGDTSPGPGRLTRRRNGKEGQNGKEGHGKEELPPWPGRVPAPAPATVHHRPLRAEVVDAAGVTVAVTGRGMCHAAPARLSVEGGPWAQVVAWAGPWLLDERWWDGAGHQRRARWQVVTNAGQAHLLAVQAGRWRVEATYD